MVLKHAGLYFGPGSPRCMARDASAECGRRSSRYFRAHRGLAGSGVWGGLLDCFYCLSLWIAIPFCSSSQQALARACAIVVGILGPGPSLLGPRRFALHRHTIQRDRKMHGELCGKKRESLTRRPSQQLDRRPSPPDRSHRPPLGWWSNTWVQLLSTFAGPSAASCIALLAAARASWSTEEMRRSSSLFQTFAQACARLLNVA